MDRDCSMKTRRVATVGALLVTLLLLMPPSGSLAHLSNEHNEQEHSDNQHQQQQPPSSLQPMATQQSQDHDDHHDHLQNHHQQQQQQQQQHNNQQHLDSSQQHQAHQQPHDQPLHTQHFDTSTQKAAFELTNHPDAYVSSPVHESHQTTVPEQHFQPHQVQPSGPVIQGPQSQTQSQQQQQHSQTAQVSGSQQSQHPLPLQTASPQIGPQMQVQPKLQPQPQSPQHDQQATVPTQRQPVQQSESGSGQNQNQIQDQLSHTMQQPQTQQQSSLFQTLRQASQSGQDQQKQPQLTQIQNPPQQQQQSNQGFQQQQPQQQQSQLAANSYQQQQATRRPEADWQAKRNSDLDMGRNYNRRLPQQYQPVQAGQQAPNNNNMLQQPQQQPQQQQQPSQAQMSAQLSPQTHSIQPLQQQQPQQLQQSPPPQQPAQQHSIPPPPPPPPAQVAQSASSGFKYQSSVMSPLYLGHNPFIEILRPLSYADDNIVTLNLSHSHIYEIDSDAFVGQRFEHIDLSNNKLGLIHSRSFRIGPNHSRHTPYDPRANSSSLLLKQQHPHQQHYATRRPPPAHPKSVTIDFSHNPAIVALSGAFDHIDVPNCLLNFTNSTVELKFGAFKKYFKEHPGHLIDIDTVDCCDQEWLLGYKHNFVARTHCAHDPNLYLLKVSQQTIIDSCIAYVTSARHSMTMPFSGIIHSAAANTPRHSSGGHGDNQQYLTYLILGGTAMILTSLSIYIIFYMFSLKAAFVYQMQTQKN